MDYLFIIKYYTREADLDAELTLIENYKNDINKEYESKVDIPYSAKNNQPKGIIVVVRFPDDATAERIETFCGRVRDRVAEINDLLFDPVSNNVLVDGNNAVVDEDLHLLVGFGDLARWAHAPMPNILTGFGNYGELFNLDKEDNNYVIYNLKGGGGGKH